MGEPLLIGNFDTIDGFIMNEKRHGVEFFTFTEILLRLDSKFSRNTIWKNITSNPMLRKKMIGRRVLYFIKY